MNLGFPVFVYYIGLFILVLILTKFIFTRYLQFAKNFDLISTPNQRSVHHGKVYTLWRNGSCHSTTCCSCCP